MTNSQTLFNSNTLDLLSHLAIVAINGPDAEKFLQGQLTCDVREITEQQSCLGAHCNPKGRVISNFRLFRLGESCYLQLPQSMLEIALTNLRKYAIFSKVTLTEANQAVAKLGFAGPTIDKILCQHFSTLPDAVDSTITEHGIQLIRIPGTLLRYQALGHQEAINSLLQKVSKELQPGNNWDLLDIFAGMPTIYPETSGLFTPHQINYQLLNGVSFKKGCYTGQEVITRMQYLGKLKQHMYRAEIIATETPQPAAKICCQEDGNLQAVGEVVMAQAIDGNYQALICLQDRAADLELSLNEDPLSHIMLLDLPYRFQS